VLPGIEADELQAPIASCATAGMMPKIALLLLDRQPSGRTGCQDTAPARIRRAGLSPSPGSASARTAAGRPAPRRENITMSGPPAPANALSVIASGSDAISRHPVLVRWRLLRRCAPPNEEGKHGVPAKAGPIHQLGRHGKSGSRLSPGTTRRAKQCVRRLGGLERSVNG